MFHNFFASSSQIKFNLTILEIEGSLEYVC